MKNEPKPATPPTEDKDSDGPSEETIQAIKGIITEIGAGKVLFPKYEGDHTHNRACDRAVSIAISYRDGYGLFQMVNRSKKASAKPE